MLDAQPLGDRHGNCDNLLTRAADVTLKERRRLVLLVRETPLHLGHLRNMAAVTEMGAIVAPPVPAFYVRPRTIADLVDHTVGRALDLFGIELGIMRRWGAGLDAAPLDRLQGNYPTRTSTAAAQRRTRFL